MGLLLRINAVFLYKVNTFRAQSVYICIWMRMFTIFLWITRDQPRQYKYKFVLFSIIVWGGSKYFQIEIHYLLRNSFKSKHFLNRVYGTMGQGTGNIYSTHCSVHKILEYPCRMPAWGWTYEITLCSIISPNVISNILKTLSIHV